MPNTPILAFARERLLERSTWRGLVLLLTGLGISIDPAHIEALAAAGAAVIGLLEILQPDSAGRMDIEPFVFELEDEGLDTNADADSNTGLSA